ncbi:MAG TPA: glutamyl-tRNA reductase [Legionellaceae bacterium]|nr:glutamyl-tRNA reductase [Legionellaceae bacterium]
MVFTVCGLNHKTAPLHIRETVALSIEKQKTLLDGLLDISDINEVLSLSTCNRTELYCDTQTPSQMMACFAQSHQLSLELLQPHLYLLEDQNAIKHSLRVASGLDSMMLGESQILGQMKQAFQNADAQNAIGTHLRHIFQFLFGASKRIRNQSGIGQHATSVAFAASKLIQQQFADLTDRSVLLIGSGETATLVAKYLHQQGVKQFIITSRSDDHARKLADMYHSEIISIQDLNQALIKADIVVSATACPYPFISQALVNDILRIRQFRSMFLLDLAVPRDIEATVGLLPHVHLYNIDDLERITQEGLQQRQAAATYAEKLIDYELKAFMHQHRVLRAKALICDYRSTMQELADQELQRALQKLSKGDYPQEVMTEFSQRLIKKFTHTPTIGLRQAALDQRDEVLDFAHYLFHSNQDSYEDLT